MSTSEITLVHAPGCHFCAEAQEALAELGRAIPLTVKLVAADSNAGAPLIAAYRPAMFPLVLLDGGFFSTGRLPLRKLRAVLAARQAVSPR